MERDVSFSSLTAKALQESSNPKASSGVPGVLVVALDARQHRVELGR